MITLLLFLALVFVFCAVYLGAFFHGYILGCRNTMECAKKEMRDMHERHMRDLHELREDWRRVRAIDRL